MTLIMETCPITKVHFNEIETVTIDPDEEETIVSFDPWIADGADLCHYTWKYLALYEGTPVEDAALAATVLFDASSRQFTFSSKVGSQNITITLLGNLSDEMTT